MATRRDYEGYWEEPGIELPQGPYENPGPIYDPGPYIPNPGPIQQDSPPQEPSPLPPPAPPQAPAPPAAPPGIPQDWADDFIRRNPGDYSRITSAYQSGGPGRTGGPSAPPPPAGGGRTPMDLTSLFGQPKQTWDPIDFGPEFAGPGDKGVFQEPLQQVGQDPLSQILGGAYGDLISRGGISPMGADIQETLKGIIGRGGAMPEGEGNERSRASLRKETAREELERARSTQSQQLGARLASRGLASEPGSPSGAELGSIGRMEERIQTPYASALRGILSEEAGFEEERLQNALTLATGLDQSQARFLLDTMGQADQRQAMLSNIALQSLSQNMEWNKFLAQLGLERGKVMAELQAGRVENMLPLIQMFLQLAQTSAGGYV